MQWSALRVESSFAKRINFIFEGFPYHVDGWINAEWLAIIGSCDESKVNCSLVIKCIDQLSGMEFASNLRFAVCKRLTLSGAELGGKHQGWPGGCRKCGIMRMMREYAQIYADIAIPDKHP